MDVLPLVAWLSLSFFCSYKLISKSFKLHFVPTGVMLAVVEISVLLASNPLCPTHCDGLRIDFLLQPKWFTLHLRYIWETLIQSG